MNLAGATALEPRCHSQAMESSQYLLSNKLSNDAAEIEIGSIMLR